MRGVWASYLMLACYYPQGKQLASGVIVCRPVNLTINVSYALHHPSGIHQATHPSEPGNTPLSNPNVATHQINNSVYMSSTQHKTRDSQTHTSITHTHTHTHTPTSPLSTMWSSPPSRRSSSLNQSPALLEVRDSSVSMARWPVCRETIISLKHSFARHTTHSQSLLNKHSSYDMVFVLMMMMIHWNEHNRQTLLTNWPFEMQIKCNSLIWLF